MERKTAERRGLQPLDVFRGSAVAGCEPDEMGIGVSKQLRRAALTVTDIGLWELNEAFAVQVLYYIDKLGLPEDPLNVDGGTIAVDHPYGVTGSRRVGLVLIEGNRRAAKSVVVIMCIVGSRRSPGYSELCDLRCRVYVRIKDSRASVFRLCLVSGVMQSVGYENLSRGEANV